MLDIKALVPLAAQNTSHPVQQVMNQRRSLLDSQCTGDRPLPDTPVRLTHDQLRNIYVDKTHRVVVCVPPKIASTTWRRLLYVLLTNGTKPVPKFGLHEHPVIERARLRFVLETRQDRREMMKYLQEPGYTRIILVRDPAKRLMSAWRDKLQRYEEACGPFMSYTLKMLGDKYKSNKTYQYAISEDDWNHHYKHQLTFGRFVSYLGKYGQRGMQEHWNTITNQCMPCIVDYTDIVHYEDIKHEMDYVFWKTKLTHLIPEYPVKPKGTDQTMMVLSGTSSNDIQVFNNLTNKQKNIVTGIFADDYRYFGYKRPT